VGAEGDPTELAQPLSLASPGRPAAITSKPFATPAFGPHKHKYSDNHPGRSRHPLLATKKRRVVFALRPCKPSAGHFAVRPPDFSAATAFEGGTV
jgi:hypothetical protein